MLAKFVSVHNYLFTLLCISTLFVVLFVSFSIVTDTQLIASTIFQQHAQSFRDISSRIGEFFSLTSDDRANNIVEDSKNLFCLIKTTPDALKSNKTLTVYNVWASRCSNYRFISLIPGELNSSIEIYDGHREVRMPFYLLQPKGIEIDVYAKITDKLYSAMRYLYSRFGDYKWYLIVDDDAYINMPNMLMFLRARNSSWPATYGHDFWNEVEGGYHSGGCGYVLSGEAFRRVGDKLTTNATFCQNTGIDDVDLAACLRHLGVQMNSSLDELGRERFLPVNFMPMFKGPVPEWLNIYSLHPPREGVDCCSDTIIGIHYMPPDQQILLETAFNSARLEIEILNNLTGLKLNVTFKNVVEKFVLLSNQTRGLLPSSPYEN